MFTRIDSQQRPHFRFIRGLALAGMFGLSTVFAAQVVTPIHVSGGTGATPNNPFSSITIPAGTAITFDVRYSVDGSQTVNESGLGLKLRYDANRFENINVTAVNAAAGNFTDVTSMNTKCAVAAPSDQAGSYSISGFTTPREVIFGWLDTSIRAGGAVGWLGTADPVAPNGCLNPGFATATGAFTVPTNLFRVTMKTKSSFTSGSTTIRLTADGNVSFANSSPGMADKDITVNGAAAPLCNLDVDDSGGTPTSNVDGILLRRALSPFWSDSVITNGVTLPPTAQRTSGAAIRAYVLSMGNVLDVDGNGASTPNSNVDGLLIQRALNPFLSSSSITSGISTSATGAQVRSYLNNNCGTNLTP